MKLNDLIQLWQIVKLAWVHRRFICMVFKDLGAISEHVGKIKKAYESGILGWRKALESVKALLALPSFCELVKLSDSSIGDKELKAAANEEVFVVAWRIVLGDWNFGTEIGSRFKQLVDKLKKRCPFLSFAEDTRKQGIMGSRLTVPMGCESDVVESVGLLYLVLSVFPKLVSLLSFKTMGVE